MSTTRLLNNLELILDRIQLNISQQSVELTAKGVTPKLHETAYAEFWAKMAVYERQLAAIVQQLANIESNLDFRGRLARKLPRGSIRYSAKQSVRTHTSHMHRVYEKAVRIEQALRDLRQRGMTPTVADTVSGIERVSREMQSTAGRTEYQAVATQLAKGRPYLDAMTRDGPVVQNVPLGFVVALIVAWVALRKRNK